MKRKSIIWILMGVLMLAPPIVIADHHLDMPHVSDPTGIDTEPPSDAMGAAKGCAAGAVAGSVIPGLGNIIGCAVGGLFGWFW